MIILLIADEHAIFYVDDLEKRSKKEKSNERHTQKRKRNSQQPAL